MRRLLVVVPLVILGAAASMSVAYAGTAPGGGDRWALVIGVDHFEGATRPNTGAVGDAEDVKAALLAAGFASDHIRVLTDGDATKSAILDGMGWLASKSSDTSLSVFAYSGHVKQVGSTEYLWPHDNAFISDTQMVSALKGVKGFLWAHISGCEAAGFDEGLSGPNRLVTAAAQSNEKGYELSPELRNSVFTNLLVDKGLLKKQADFDKDGKVSIQEAFKLAADRAPGMTEGESNGAQHPYIAGGDGTPWYLNRTAAQTVAPDPPPPPKKTCILFICL